MGSVKTIIKAWGIPFLCALLVMLLFQFVFMIGYVPSVSMEPTIPKKSFILGLRIHGGLQHGDIVIFRMNGRKLVKRIAAVPGDSVHVRGPEAEVNCAWDEATKVIEVPEGHFYMLGDNAIASIDSRYWEEPFIHEQDILARLVAW